MLKRFIIFIVVVAGAFFAAVKLYQYQSAQKPLMLPVSPVKVVTEQAAVVPAVSSGVVVSTSSGVLAQGQQESPANVLVEKPAVVTASSGVLAQTQQVLQKPVTNLPSEKTVFKNTTTVVQKSHPQLVKKSMIMPKRTGAKTVFLTTKPQTKNMFAAKEKFGEPWVAVGYGQYYIDNPDFTIGSKSETDSTPFMSNENDGWTDMYNVEVGYQFNRPDNLFRKFFGDNPTVSFSMDYEHPMSSSANNASSTGELYKITGGLITTGDYPTLRNTSLKAKDEFMNLGLYLSGLHKTRWSRFSFDPYIGLVYSQDKDEYDFFSTYQVSAVPLMLMDDEENYRLKTKYYGVSGGSQFNYQLSSMLTAFLDIQLQLLHAEANLNVNQTYEAEPSVYLSLNDSDHRAVTYKGMLAGGFNYHFINSPNSVALNLIGGVHHYGYAAEIVTPHADHDAPVHLKGDNIDDMFVMAQLAVPLPFLT